MGRSTALAVLLLVILSTARVAGAELDSTASTGCRCMMTLAGEGVVKQAMCDGFVPATHQRCDCEKVEQNGQPVCKPKSDSKPAPASAQRRSVD